MSRCVYLTNLCSNQNGIVLQQQSLSATNTIKQLIIATERKAISQIKEV